MGAAQCVPRERWKPNEQTECASEHQTERLLVAENLLSVTHAHVTQLFTHTHTLEFRHTNTARNGRAQSHPNRDEPISRRQTISVTERDGGRKKEWAKYIKALRVQAAAEREMQLRHLHTLTLSRKPMWPEANPFWHSRWIMWRDVWGRLRWHSLILFTEWPRRKSQWKTDTKRAGQMDGRVN